MESGQQGSNPDRDHGEDESSNPVMALGELSKQMRSMEGRDLELWTIGLLVFVVLSAGFVALVFPNWMWGLGSFRMEGR